MDTQGVINLVVSALLGLALFNVRQIFQRLDQLEDDTAETAVNVAKLGAETTGMSARLERIEGKLDRVIERDFS